MECKLVIVKYVPMLLVLLTISGCGIHSRNDCNSGDDFYIDAANRALIARIGADEFRQHRVTNIRHTGTNEVSVFYEINSSGPVLGGSLSVYIDSCSGREKLIIFLE